MREQVFAILAEVLPERVDAEGKVSADTGRPGMAQWKILVLGTLRLGSITDVGVLKGCEVYGPRPEGATETVGFGPYRVV